LPPCVCRIKIRHTCKRCIRIHIKTCMWHAAPMTYVSKDVLQAVFVLFHSALSVKWTTQGTISQRITNSNGLVSMKQLLNNRVVDLLVENLFNKEISNEHTCSSLETYCSSACCASLSTSSDRTEQYGSNSHVNVSIVHNAHSVVSS
jgi:hypothetical protein